MSVPFENHTGDQRKDQKKKYVFKSSVKAKLENFCKNIDVRYNQDHIPSQCLDNTEITSLEENNMIDIQELEWFKRGGITR